ncbi:exosortase C-terminal domain/associated protein EpsI [Aquabacterium sp.]|uniref:exosortase C-terminal domain/associated protein EpsI n=1 Tax=Aquabacterium sp. TaxID=1872578 RepID=UPI0035AF801B
MTSPRHPTRRAALLLTAGMLTTAGGAAWFKPRAMAELRPRVRLEDIFPRQFGRWRTDPGGEIFVRPPDVQADIYATYSAVLERIYIDDQGRRVMLSVAYSERQSTRDQLHLPERCYAFRGFRVSDAQRGVLRLQGQDVPVTRLDTALPNRPEPLTYWMVVGDEVVPDMRGMRNRVLKLGLQGLLPDGMLVRVSTIDPDAQRGWADQARFAGELAAAIPEALRPRVLGRVNPG